MRTFGARTFWMLSSLSGIAIAVACGSDGDSNDGGANASSSSGTTSSSGAGSSSGGSSGASSSGGSSSGSAGDGAADAGPTKAFLYIGQISGNGMADNIIRGFTWAADGTLTAIPMTVAPTVQPAYAVAASPSGKWLYSAYFAGIGAYAVDPTTGVLTHVSLGGDSGNGDLPVGAHFVATDPKGRLLYATADTSLLAYSIDDATGKLTLQREVKTLQQPTYVGWIAVDPEARYLLVSGSGGIALHALEPVSGLPLTPDGGPTAYGLGGNNYGSGESIHPSGLTVYDSTGSTLRAYSVDPTTLSVTYQGGGAPINAIYPFESVTHPNGKTVYAVGHGHGGYVVGDGGLLTMTSYSPVGAFCHAITLDPNGSHLYTACKTEIYVSDIDASTGALALRDASVSAYDGSVAGYGTTHAFAWIPR